MRVGRKFTGLVVAALILFTGVAQAAETGWVTIHSFQSKLLPLKKKLFEQGEYTKATGMTCAVRGGKAMMKFSYVTSKTQYYENAMFFANKKSDFDKKIAKARSLGFGGPVDKCHLVGKKPGQEIFVAVFNKATPVPDSVTAKQSY